MQIKLFCSAAFHSFQKTHVHDKPFKLNRKWKVSTLISCTCLQKHSVYTAIYVYPSHTHTHTHTLYYALSSTSFPPHLDHLWVYLWALLPKHTELQFSRGSSSQGIPHLLRYWLFHGNRITESNKSGENRFIQLNGLLYGRNTCSLSISCTQLTTKR